MAWLKKIFKVFAYVVTANTVGAAIYTGLFSRGDTMEFFFLWQIIILSGLCAIGNFIFYSKRELDKQKILIRHILHYVYINVIILGGGGYFQWVPLGFRLETLVLFLIILLEYCIIMYSTFIKDSKTAEEMNQKLKVFNQKEEL